MIRPFKSRVLTFGLLLFLLTGLPALIQGEILVLKDGSELRGTIVTFRGDTLVFEPSFGGQILVHRDDIAQIIYDESETRQTPSPAQQQTGDGFLKVTFDHTKMSSKVEITNKLKSRTDEIIRANWIQYLVIVGGDTLFSRTDSTMDKTVFKGHVKQFKNTIELEDVSVTIPAGVYNCQVVIRNAGAESHREMFENDPIDQKLAFETTAVYKDMTTTLGVDIKKGFLRMGKPRLVAKD